MSESRIIVASNFTQLLKTGVYFSIDNDDRVFTGDLFFDLAFKEFQMRGIPAVNGRRRHVFEAKFKGPTLIDLLVANVGIEQVRPNEEKYVDLTFSKGKITGQLAAHIEEWYGGTALALIVENFEVVNNLTWYKT